MTPTPFFVGHQRRLSGEPREIRSPDDGRVVALVHQASAADADEAAALAHAAATPFSRTSTDDRRRFLEAVSRAIQERQEQFASAISEEAGKPIALARAETQRAVETFHLAAGEAERMGGEVLPVDLMPATAGYHCLTRRVPRGPVLAIGPFNFPLNLLAHKIAPALAVGAPVVIKPPPQAPTAALLLGELLAKLAPPHWPEGIFSILPCSNEVAERLVKDARFAVLSFTGSGPVGWRLKALAVRQHVVLELGGDAAVIVAEDADLDATARRIAWGAMAYAGQVCISVQRVLVQASIFRAFAGKLAEAVRAIPSGPANDERTVSGSVIDDRAATRIAQTIEEAAKQGTLLAGGTPRSQRLIAPTLLAEVPMSSPLATDEVFGPVAAVWPYERFDEALELVNRSQYGLQAGLFTYDLRRMFAAHERLQVGGLIVNDIPTLRVDNYPYGGTKGSGLGREGGRSGIEEYTESRVLVVNPK